MTWIEFLFIFCLFFLVYNYVWFSFNQQMLIFHHMYLDVVLIYSTNYFFSIKFSLGLDFLLLFCMHFSLVNQLFPSWSFAMWKLKDQNFLFIFPFVFSVIFWDALNLLIYQFSLYLWSFYYSANWLIFVVQKSHFCRFLILNGETLNIWKDNFYLF